MPGKWQRLILKTLEKHNAFRLTDLLGEPYSLSDYNALTRAFRNLLRKGVVAGYWRDGRLVVTKPHLLRHTWAAEPEELSAQERVRSTNLKELERLAWSFHRHPRIIWRSVTFTRALDRLAAISGVPTEELAKRRTLSQAACRCAAVLSFERPEAVAKVVREAWERRERIWFTRDLLYLLYRTLPGPAERGPLT